MFSIIKTLWYKRAFNKIKGNAIKDYIKKLQILSKLTPNTGVPTYVLDRIKVTVYCDEVHKLPRRLQYIIATLENQDNYTISSNYGQLKEDSVSMWCMKSDLTYVKLISILPDILKCLIAISELMITLKDKDPLYVEYVVRKTSTTIEDIGEYIRVVHLIHYK